MIELQISIYTSIINVLKCPKNNLLMDFSQVVYVLIIYYLREEVVKKTI